MPKVDFFYIKIAGLTVEMRAKYPFVKKLCRDYLVEPVQKPDIVAFATDEEIQKEMVEGDGFSPAYCESVCLYRAIAEKLPYFNKFVFHGASISYGERGYLFAAPSGTGKSTHIKLWFELLGDSTQIINGDKPILSVDNGNVFICSTPWAGKEGWQRNVSYPLASICLLSRGEENSISRISPSEHFNEIIRQIYIPFDSEARLKTLELLDIIAKQVDFYNLYCNMSLDAARTAFDTMVVNKENGKL